MTLITLDELARGACIGVFGGLAGVCTITFPGSPLWLAPAALAVGGCALTVPEVRAEVARYVPQLAEGAQRARAALPGAAWALPGIRAERRPQAAQGPAQGRSKAPSAPRGALPPREWLRAVNERPDDNPHMTVVGPSGSGKTTFVSAALGARPGRVVVLTPKVSPGAWRGAEVATLGDDLSYDPLAQALGDLQTEARRRSVALKNGERLEPLTVVLDELPELHAEIPGAGKFAVRLSRWGRELNMRQVVIATSDDALNIPGWAATRPNYVRVELDKPAEDGTRAAWLDDGQARRPLDLGDLREQAQGATLRPWRGGPEPTAPAPARRAVAAEGGRAEVITMRVPEPRPTGAASSAQAVDLSFLLDSLLAEPVSNASESARHTAGVSVSVSSATDTDTDTGGVSKQTHTLVTPAEGAPTLRIDVHARAESGATPVAPVTPGGRRRRPGGLDAHRRRLLAEGRRSDAHKAAQAAAYAERKAAGLSYRKAYAELGGAADETRAWWHAAPAPAQKG